MILFYRRTCYFHLHVVFSKVQLFHESLDCCSHHESSQWNLDTFGPMLALHTSNGPLRFSGVPATSVHGVIRYCARNPIVIAHIG